MFIRKLILNNFRNYHHLESEFAENGIFITGNNGIGKTNILEAIYYLTLGRSFRKSEDKDLILNGEKEASVYLVFHSESDQKDHTLSCVIGNGYKIFSYDDEKIKSLSKILGKLLAVYYDPSLVFFFKGEPMERRRLLDATLSQLSPEYLYALTRYRKILKERNQALVQNYDPDVTLVLRNELINLAYRIVKERKDLCKTLSAGVKEYYNKLFGEGHTLKLTYKTTSPLEDDQEAFVKESIALFEHNQSLENMRKTTLIGPHRDDLMAALDGNELAGYGSQGENRIASLSLKLSILDDVTKKLNNRPILLLDDVTSDLDDRRTENLLSCINQKGQQVFVTGTNVRNGFETYEVLASDGNTLTRRNQHD